MSEISDKQKKIEHRETTATPLPELSEHARQSLADLLGPDRTWVGYGQPPNEDILRLAETLNDPRVSKLNPKQQREMCSTVRLKLRKDNPAESHLFTLDQVLQKVRLVIDKLPSGDLSDVEASPQAAETRSTTGEEPAFNRGGFAPDTQLRQYLKESGHQFSEKNPAWDMFRKALRSIFDNSDFSGGKPVSVNRLKELWRALATEDESPKGMDKSDYDFRGVKKAWGVLHMNEKIIAAGAYWKKTDDVPEERLSTALQTLTQLHPGVEGTKILLALRRRLQDLHMREYPCRLIDNDLLDNLLTKAIDVLQIPNSIKGVKSCQVPRQRLKRSATDQ